MSKTLNIFYDEPNPDRWIKFDRYPRELVRRLVRGKAKPGGVMMVALELMRGLDLLGIPYRFNDYQYAKRNPNELIGVIGKPHLIFEKRFKNPILFGAGVFSHPVEAPDLFEKYPNVKKMLVPGEWMRKMCEPYYGDRVLSWPVGIDTKKWVPSDRKEIKYDFLIYDKIRWNYEEVEHELIQPLKNKLLENQHTFTVIKYGSYNHQELHEKLEASKAVIFLCEHETQGLAYQQILATDTPILAWDKEAYWVDPHYYPDRVKYKPVSSVPYWDERCGLKFKSLKDFQETLSAFNEKVAKDEFSPRAFILENLSLEVCAKKYVDIYNSIG